MPYFQVLLTFKPVIIQVRILATPLAQWYKTASRPINCWVNKWDIELVTDCTSPANNLSSSGEHLLYVFFRF